MAKNGAKVEPKPQFFVLHPNEEDFYLCLEQKGKLLTWHSIYPPSMDPRYPRQLGPTRAKPAEEGAGIWDKGSYSIKKLKSKKETEAALARGLKENKLVLTLQGKKLQGRFTIRRKGHELIIHKYKDKFAREEDPLSSDLERTIRSMMPEYDPARYKLRPRKTSKVKKPAQTIPKPQVSLPVTPELAYKGKRFVLSFCREAQNGALLCLIRSGRNIIYLFEETEPGAWHPLQLKRNPSPRLAKTISDRIEALVQQKEHH